MDPNTLNILKGAAGAGGGGDPVYVEDVFSTHLYKGTGATNPIDNGIDLDGEGGMVWLKGRNDAYSHHLYDTERDVQEMITSQDDDAETTVAQGVTAFNDDGFTIGTEGVINSAGTNDVYASWTFRKAPGFFDIVTYEGDDVAGREIAHNLGSVPGMIIIKNLDETYDWAVYHRSLPNTHYARLNKEEEAESTNNYWNDTTATSTHFTLGDHGSVNYDGSNLVAYIFAHDDQQFGEGGDESIIKCGTYAGVGSGKVEVNIGFEPQWIMIKNIDSSSAYAPWMIFDNMRGVAVGGNDAPLSANYNDAEDSTYNWVTNYIDFTSTGFNVIAGNTPTCVSGKDFIYIAIRRGPMKTPEDATEVFNVVKTSSQPISIGFTTDLAIVTATTNPSANYFVPRLTNLDLDSASTTYELTNGEYFEFDLQNNFSTGTFFTGWETINWMFKRAPGFFDVVCYEGTGSAKTEAHNLGVEPEMMLIKCRDASYDWMVYHKDLNGGTSAEGYYLILNEDDDEDDSSTIWNSTAPDESVFTVGTSDSTNKNDKSHVAYLFASLDGISSVGTFTVVNGGSNIDVDCEFTAGARFVMIKRTDGSGNWMIFDTTRGINADGVDDPYLKVNVTTAQVTDDDYINPHPESSGFQANSDLPSGDYIYLAIA